MILPIKFDPVFVFASFPAIRFASIFETSENLPNFGHLHFLDTHPLGRIFYNNILLAVSKFKSICRFICKFAAQIGVYLTVCR